MTRADPPGLPAAPWWPLGVCLALVVVLLAGCQPWRTGEVTDLRTAIRITQNERAPDTVQTVALPDAWPDGRTAVGSAVYRLHFNSSPSLRPQALLIPRVGNFVSVRLNGSEIAQVDQPTSVLRDTSFEPVMLYLPDALLDDDNLLELHVTGRGGAGAGLSRMMVGPASQIARYFGIYWSLSIGLLMIMFTVGGFVLLFAALLWRGTRDRLYLGLGGSAAALTAQAWMLLRWNDSPITWGAAAAVLVTYHTHIALIGFCALHMLGTATARLCGLTLLYWIGMTGAVLLSAAIESMLPYLLVRLLGVALVAVALAITVRIVFARSSLSALTLVGAALIGIAYAVRDILSGLAGDTSYGELPLHRLTAPGFMITVIMFVIEQYTHSFRKLHRLNATLERRVADARASLQRAFESLRTAEQAAAIEQERRRLMRDIHDGLGSQLIATLSLAEQPTAARAEIVEAIESCITELRVAIDSLEPFEDDLLVALGTLRTRIEPMLTRAGVRLRWRVRELHWQPELAAADVGQVLKLLLEALTNIVKHSHATQATLSCASSRRTGQVWVSIRDNGTGFSPEQSRRSGRGLANMQERAEKIGARLSIRPRQRGASIRLVWQSAQAQQRATAVDGEPAWPPTVATTRSQSDPEGSAQL